MYKLCSKHGVAKKKLYQTVTLYQGISSKRPAD